MNLKFRAWLKEEKQMCSVTEIDFHNGSVDVHPNPRKWPFYCYEEGEEAILMESTGIKDANGVEIFEGDILKVCDDDGTHLEPVYRDGQALVIDVTFQDFDSSTVKWGLYCYHGYDDSDNEYPIIVGNIHENPELIEVKNDD